MTFAATLIRRAGREVSFARAGETVAVGVPVDAGPDLPRKGQQIRHLSSRFLDLPEPREAGFPLYKVAIDLDVRLASDGTLDIQAAGASHFQTTVTVDKAARPRPFAPILSALLEESGDSLFRPGRITFSNDTGLDDNGIFVPPSELKKAKNDYYDFLQTERPGVGLGRTDAPLPPRDNPIASPLQPEELVRLAHRELLVPEGVSPVPFVGNDPGALSIDRLPELAGFRWLPIPPVITADGVWSAALRRLAEGHPETRLAFGLNNLSHIELARQLQTQPNAWFFADFFLYMANRRALDLVTRIVPRLLFAYEWLEEGAARPAAPAADPVPGAVPLVRISADFTPPLFYGFGCFARHVLNNGQCDDTCPKDFIRELRQGKSRFQVVVRDCITYLFAAAK